MSVMEAIFMLDNLVDESDPDVSSGVLSYHSPKSACYHALLLTMTACAMSEINTPPPLFVNDI